MTCDSRYFWLSIVFVGVLAAQTSPVYAERDSPVIWECGQNTPTAAYWRQHADELEKLLPFDGVMLNIEHPVTEGGTFKVDWRHNVGWKIFMREKVTAEMVKPFVDDMRAANLKKLKHNLVNVCPYPYPHIMDWFDDAWWQQICDDMRTVAKAAKDAGCIGIVFDPEQYGPRTRLWNWRSLVGSTNRKQSYEEYDAKVRQRGREFGKALSEGFADCTILFFHGYSIVPLRSKEWIEMGRGKQMRDSDHTLFAPWLDGMLQGTSDGTVFVDGYETSYSYIQAKQFEQGVWDIKRQPLGVTRVPDLFRKKTRAGFGIWMDNTFNDYKWFPRNPQMNRFSPGRLQRTIHLALKHSDGYVWLWSERPNWYLDGPDAKPHAPAQQQEKSRGIDRRYRHAVTGARDWPGVDTTMPPKKEFVDDRTLGFVDREKLEKLLARTKKLADLPSENWLFMPDRKNVGAKSRWFDLATKTADWKPIKIGDFWERQGYSDLDGIAWYRRDIKFSELPADANLYLSFGAVDESLALWIDGRYVGAYDRGGMGWDKPFALDITNFIQNDKTHTLIFRTRDIGRMGGIWKGIELIAE